MKSRKSISILLMAIALSILLVGQVFAGNDGRRGTAGATELLIPVGSRGTALSGSINALVSGVEALHWNPAGIARSAPTEAMFSSLNYIADIKLNYFGVVANFGDLGAFALSMRSLDFGDIPITTVDNPEGTGGNFSPSYLTFALSYSHEFTDRIYGGVTAKLVTEKIVRSTASGYAFDVGVQYLSTTGIKLGVALKNLGFGMQYDGPDLEYFTTIPGQEQGARTRALRLPSAAFEFPSTLEIGVGYEYTVGDQHVLAVMGNFQNANFAGDQFSAGVEYTFEKMLFLRGGIMQSQNQDENIFGPTFGFGVNVPVGGANLGFDYAYRTTDFFNGSQWFTIKVGL
jgi:hypothetical protein